MSNVSGKPSFPVRERIEARAAQRRSSPLTGGLPLLVAAIITVVVLVTGALIVRSFVTGSLSFPDVSFDSAVNSTVDAVVGLVPGAFNDDDGPTIQATTRTSSPTPLSSPSPTPLPSIDPASVGGSPLSLQSLTSAWESKGMEATAQAADADLYRGFDLSPVTVTLTKSGKTAEVAAFLYEGRGAAGTDWNTPAGERPSPKSGRSLPQHTSVWWNQNAIVVLLNDSGLGSEAREAFFDAR
jgi:hypothetical protein